jgi:hypothetical protein
VLTYILSDRAEIHKLLLPLLLLLLLLLHYAALLLLLLLLLLLHYCYTAAATGCCCLLESDIGGHTRAWAAACCSDLHCDRLRNHYTSSRGRVLCTPEAIAKVCKSQSDASVGHSCHSSSAERCWRVQRERRLDQLSTHCPLLAIVASQGCKGAGLHSWQLESVAVVRPIGAASERWRRCWRWSLW